MQYNCTQTQCGENKEQLEYCFARQMSINCTQTQCGENNEQLEYCFAREKQMSTNDLVKIASSLFNVFPFMQKFNLPAKIAVKHVGKTIFGKIGR